MFDPPKTPNAAPTSGDPWSTYMNTHPPTGASSSLSIHIHQRSDPQSHAFPWDLDSSASSSTNATTSLSTTPPALGDPFQVNPFAAPSYQGQPSGHRNSVDTYFASSFDTLASGATLSPSLSASPVQFEFDQLKTPVARHFAPPFASTSSSQLDHLGAGPSSNLFTMSPFPVAKSPMPFPVSPSPQPTYGTCGSMVVAPHIIQPSQAAVPILDHTTEFMSSPKSRPLLRTSHSHNGTYTASSPPPLWTRRPIGSEYNDRRPGSAGPGTILPPTLTPTTVLASGSFAAPPPPPPQLDMGLEHDKSQYDRITRSTSPSVSSVHTGHGYGSIAFAGGQGQRVQEASRLVPESTPTPVPHLSTHNADANRQGSASTSVTPRLIATHVDPVIVTHPSPCHSEDSQGSGVSASSALGPSCATIPPVPIHPQKTQGQGPAGPAGASIMNHTDTPVAVTSSSVTVPGTSLSSSLVDFSTTAPLALPQTSSLSSYAAINAVHVSASSAATATGTSHAANASTGVTPGIFSASLPTPRAGNKAIHPPPQTITTIHPPLPPYQQHHNYKSHPPRGQDIGSSHPFSSSAPTSTPQGLHHHNPYSTPIIGNLNLSSSFSSPPSEPGSYTYQQTQTPLQSYASLPPPPLTHSASHSNTTSRPNILYPYHPYALAAMKAKMMEPILAPGEMPAPRPMNSYVALIGEALLAAPPPHQLYVSEISDMIKRKYPYYRQNPSRVYNGVRHQTSMCPAFVKLTRPSGEQNGGAHKWAIRSGYETYFHSGGYHPPNQPAPVKGRSASHSGTGKAKSTAQSKRLAIGISSPEDFRGKKQLHEPFSPSTGYGGPSLGPAYDGTSKPTWYMASDPESEDTATPNSPLMPFTPTPTYHNPHPIQLPPPQPQYQVTGGHTHSHPPLPFSASHPPAPPPGLSQSAPQGFYYVPIQHSQPSQQPHGHHYHPLHGHGQHQSMTYAPPGQSQPHYYSSSPAMPYQQPSYGSYPSYNNHHASPSPATQYIPTPVAAPHAQLQNVQYASSPESNNAKFAPQSFGSNYGNSHLYQYGQSDDEDGRFRHGHMQGKQGLIPMGSPDSIRSGSMQHELSSPGYA